MNKFLYLTCILFSAVSFSQNKFIEVQVRDTITLQPKTINYNILISDFTEDEEWVENQTFDQKGYDKRVKQNKEKVEKLLKSKMYNYMPYSGNITYPPLSAPNIVGFTVALKNKQDLKAIQELFSDFNFITSSIDLTEYKDEEKAEELLLKKLVDKAKLKASLLANYSNLKLGKIIEVKEGKELDDLSFNFQDIYVEGLSKRFSEEKLTGSLSKSIAVKFAAE